MIYGPISIVFFAKALQNPHLLKGEVFYHQSWYIAPIVCIFLLIKNNHQEVKLFLNLIICFISIFNCLNSLRR